MEEKLLEAWSVKGSQRLQLYFFFYAALVLISFLLFYVVFIVIKSTSLVTLIVPILFLIATLSAFPDFLSSFSCFKGSYSVKIGEKGVYLVLPGKELNYKFLAWESIHQYDLKIFKNSTPLGFLFPKPTRIFLRASSEEDSLVVDGFGLETETLIALLKEKRVQFGFMQK